MDTLFFVAIINLDSSKVSSIDTDNISWKKIDIHTPWLSEIIDNNMDYLKWIDIYELKDLRISGYSKLLLIMLAPSPSEFLMLKLNQKIIWQSGN